MYIWRAGALRCVRRAGARGHPRTLAPQCLEHCRQRAGRPTGTPDPRCVGTGCCRPNSRDGLRAAPARSALQPIGLETVRVRINRCRYTGACSLANCRWSGSAVRQPQCALRNKRCGPDAAGQGAVLPPAVLIRRGARCCPRGCGGRILAEAVGAPAQFANLPRLVCILFSAVARPVSGSSSIRRTNVPGPVLSCVVPPTPRRTVVTLLSCSLRHL